MGKEWGGEQIVQWCIRQTRLTLICIVIRHRLVQVRQNPPKKTLRLAARSRLSVSLPLSFSSSSYFLSFSQKKKKMNVVLSWPDALSVRCVSFKQACAHLVGVQSFARNQAGNLVLEVFYSSGGVCLVGDSLLTSFKLHRFCSKFWVSGCWTARFPVANFPCDLIKKKKERKKSGPTLIPCACELFTILRCSQTLIMCTKAALKSHTQHTEGEQESLLKSSCSSCKKTENLGLTFTFCNTPSLLYWSFFLYKRRTLWAIQEGV